MVALDNRNHERLCDETPIEYATFNSKHFTRAVSLNVSCGGIYFESPTNLEPGSDVCIKMPKEGAGADVLVPYRFFRAKVKWSRPLTHPHVEVYGNGVQYLVRSCLDNGPTYSCALCGEVIPYGQLRVLEEFVYLNDDWYHRYQDLPEGCIKQSLRDLIDGNVI